MAFYKPEITIGLVIASIPALASMVVFLFYKKDKLALWLIVGSAFLYRLLMAVADPFLHHWDERFHALVAKNMMAEPLKPMLIADPVLPYNIWEWYNTHIWLHKQPLFLWQMATSMKLFGVETWAFRIPSVIMGTLAVYMLHETAFIWTKNRLTAYVSALLLTFSHYQLELTSGLFMLDQNDVAFAFYIGAGIWALAKYIESSYKVKWAIIIGLFAGCAVLCKWLTGLLIFGGWGIYILIAMKNIPVTKKYSHLSLAGVVALCIFLPWQLYIMKQFPEVSSYEYAYNTAHVFEPVEGHAGDNWYHIEQIKQFFRKYFFVFTFIGFVWSFRSKNTNKMFSLAATAMIVVMFAFFTFAQTKMPSFTYPVAGLLLIFTAHGMATFSTFLFKFLLKNRLITYQPYILLALLLIVSKLSIKPSTIRNYRRPIRY